MGRGKFGEGVWDFGRGSGVGCGEGVEEGGQEVGVVDLEGEFLEDVLVAEGGFLEAGMS